jgi:hypothetical protein
VNEKAPPVLQALVLADHIYTDAQTGKRVICGTFSKIWCKGFPAVLGTPIWAFILLVEAIGDVTIQLRLVQLESNKIVLECNPITIHSARSAGYSDPDAVLPFASGRGLQL